MSRLPTPGADDNTWGSILNDFLAVSLASDGTINPNTVGTTQLQSGSITNTQVSSTAAISPTKIVGTAEVQTNRGQPNGYAPLDGTGKVPSANLPTSSSSSPILAVISYFPGSTANTAFTSSSYANLDATNVAITFTTTSTAVIVQVQLCIEATFNQSGNAAVPGVLGLLESGTTVAELSATNSANFINHTVTFYVSGLSANTTHTYTLAAHGNGTNGVRIAYGTGYGPLIMIVTAI